MTKITAKELHERQKWTLNQKIDHSLGILEAFVNKMGGVNNVYVSFSGGKDSTVLLHLAHRLYPDIHAVFCNTGNEWPEISRFVNSKIKAGEDIEVIRPKLLPTQVWEKYGFPLVSKEQAGFIQNVRFNPDSPTSQLRLSDDTRRNISKKWRYLIDAPYDVHDICCDKLKKEPMKQYEKQSGRHPIIGILAAESFLRENQYIKAGGCNVFGQHPASKPLSIWLPKDVDEYVRLFDIELAAPYKMGVRRTGCMCCAFGANRANDQRFDILFREHPEIYNFVMNVKNHGVTFREAVRDMLKVDGRYLPDEHPNYTPTAYKTLQEYSVEELEAELKRRGI